MCCMGIQGYKLQYEHLDIGSRYLLYKHKIYVLYEYKLKHNNNKIKRFHVPIHSPKAHSKTNRLFYSQFFE